MVQVAKCPNCNVPLPTTEAKVECMICKESFMNVEQGPVSTTVIPTRLGTFMFHPVEQRWFLFAEGGAEMSRTVDLENEWSVDLTTSSQPMQELDDAEKNKLKNILLELSEGQDTMDNGWSTGERLQQLFETTHAGRNNVESMISSLGISEKSRSTTTTA